VLSARKFTIPEVHLGALVLHDVPGHEIVFAPDYAPPKKDGQLGFAFLRNYTVVVDFPGRRLKLYDAADAILPSECGTRVAPLEIGPAGLQSVARTNRGTIRVAWDTAAQVSMLTPEALSVPDSRYVLGKQYELAEFTIGNVKLGPLKVRSVKSRLRLLQPARRLLRPPSRRRGDRPAASRQIVAPALRVAYDPKEAALRANGIGAPPEQLRTDTRRYSGNLPRGPVKQRHRCRKSSPATHDSRVPR
jgi:hypothetical protein